MKISLKWLKEYIFLNLPPADLAQKITLAGTEVAHIDVIGGWKNVFVGQIVDIKPHPQADRLRLATVNLGTEEETVVCGAPNLNIGDKIAFARVGAELTDGHTGEKSVLKLAKIRGVESRGMVCSEKELGLSQAHEGILVLPPEAPLGASLADYMGDIIFDLEVTPNRPDLLSVLGVAHEAGALTGVRVEEPNLDYATPGGPIETRVSVEIRDPELCPRYCASLITGVSIGESPGWLKERLAAAGVRAISNVVDITNYVMLEYGQPLHAFDFDRITDGKIIIRRAAEAEEMTTLDGVGRHLSSETLVIADPARPIAIAGVMGGATSEVGAATVNILLESASFKPASIHHTAANLKMGSEASQRFERGISPLMTMPALRRATQLMVQLCRGTAAQGVIDRFPGRQERPPIRLSLAEVRRIIGMEISLAQAERVLSGLGFEFTALENGAFAAAPPYWRSDIKISADVIEEIARIIGYDKIPYSRLPAALPEFMPGPMLNLKRRVRRQLKGYGFSEIVTYAFTAEEILAKAVNDTLSPTPLLIANPMNPDQGCLRSSLRGNLLRALADNIRREEGEILVFEQGRVYLRRDGNLPEEPEMLCALLASTGSDKRWRGRKEAVDWFDAKGAVEGLLAELMIDAAYTAGSDRGLKPGAQAAVIAGGNVLGVLGELHPDVARAFELPPGVFLFEINVSSLLKQAGEFTYRSLPRFPAVERDLALVADQAVAHRQVVDVIEKHRLVADVRLFDVYTGKQVAPGKRSLAYRLVFQSPERTLKDVEVDGVMAAIVKELSLKLGAELRS